MEILIILLALLFRFVLPLAVLLIIGNWLDKRYPEVR